MHRSSRGDIERDLIPDIPICDSSITSPYIFHEVFTLLFCVAYLPFSKYFHMITAPSDHSGQPGRRVNWLKRNLH